MFNIFKDDPEHKKFSQKYRHLYDIVIIINSFLDITKGFTVKYPIYELYKNKYQNDLESVEVQQNILQAENNLTNQSRSVVSILGLYNRGKSYVLAKIFGLDLNSSYFTHTEGLSIVTSRADICAVLIGLDTKGSQKPVPRGDRALIKDAEATERFLQTLSLKLSDVVLIVVNRLTRDDQLYITEVKQTFKNPENIIVVHNFTHVTKIDDLHKIIKEEIEDCFQAKFCQVGNESPYWTSPDSTRHVVLAKDELYKDSIAGRLYNKRTIELLQGFLKACASNCSNRSDLVSSTVDFTKKVITNYLEIDQKPINPLDGATPTVNPLTNIELVTPNVNNNLESSMIVINPPLPEGTSLKYADLRFNMVGIISKVINTTSRVEEYDINYYITLDCTGFSSKELRFSFENADKATEITIQSDTPKFLKAKGNNLLHNDINSHRTLNWSYSFPTRVTQATSKDLTKDNCSLENGILNIKLTKFKNSDDGVANF